MVSLRMMYPDFFLFPRVIMHCCIFALTCVENCFFVCHSSNIHWPTHSGVYVPEISSRFTKTSAEREEKGKRDLLLKRECWLLMSFQAAQLSSKESTCQCRRCEFNPWVRKIPWRRKWKTHSSILVWEIPWTEEHGGLQFKESHRVWHDLATKQQP